MTTSSSDGSLAAATVAAIPRRDDAFWPAVALPLLLLLVTVATVLSYNTPHPLVLAPTDGTRQVFYGFHGLEYAEGVPFRWTNGNGRICLEQIGRVAQPLLSVRILGGGAYALGRKEVQFFVNNRPIVTAPIDNVTRVYHIHLGDAMAARDNDCIGIVSAAAPTDWDVRVLGVPFGGLTLTPTINRGFTLPPFVQPALNLALAGLAFWFLRRVGVGPWPALAGVGTVVVLLAAAIRAGAIAPGLALTRAMLPLALGATAVAVYVVGLRATRAWRASASLLTRDLLAMLFWSAVLVLVTEVLQLLFGYSSVWPLKAGFFPNYTPTALVPTALFAGWAWLVLRHLGTGAHRGPVLSVGLVLLGALMLSAAVKAGTRGWEGLFSTFTNNPYEYIADVPRVGDNPGAFLRDFVQIKDTLALHSSTHPPGSILLLWAVEELLGPGPVPASWVAMGLSAMAPLAGLWIGFRLGGPRLGLLAGAVGAVMPGQIVYGATSMDGVFNMLLACGAAAFLLALERPMRPWVAALAGLLIAVGLFFTYAATQLFFFGVTVATVAVWRGWGDAPGQGPRRLWAAAVPVLAQGLIAASVIVLLYLGLFLASGFNVVEGAFRATAINAEVMRSVTVRPFLPPSLAYYTLFLVANLVAYCWYLGPWGLTATVGAGTAALERRPPEGLGALALGLLALVSGMAISGLFNRKVERIWGFTYPLLAVLVARHALQGTAREQHWRAGLYLSLAFAHGLAVRVLLNTFW